MCQTFFDVFLLNRCCIRATSAVYLLIGNCWLAHFRMGLRIVVDSIVGNFPVRILTGNIQVQVESLEAYRDCRWQRVSWAIDECSV